MAEIVDTAESAYALIASVLQSAAISQEWDLLVIEAPILGHNLGGTTTWQKLVSGEEIDLQIGWKIFDIQEAAIFLRGHIFRDTGQRIWGIKFKLYRTGKFHLEYDYNKPEGYEETDETISGDEINESLARLARKDDASS